MFLNELLIVENVTFYTATEDRLWLVFFNPSTIAQYQRLILFCTKPQKGSSKFWAANKPLIFAFGALYQFPACPNGGVMTNSVQKLPCTSPPRMQPHLWRHYSSPANLGSERLSTHNIFESRWSQRRAGRCNPHRLSNLPNPTDPPPEV